jgi:7,8-didemethyl-8-hydroxy-5-deazariboflavin synthase CofH subunit
MTKSPPEEISGLLEHCLQGRDLDQRGVTSLLLADAVSLPALMAAADRLREETVGPAVTYVVNRNINFTNLCVKRCRFCSFSRGPGDPEAYFLSLEEIVRRAQEAAQLGASEICLQAGLAPDIPPGFYGQMCKALRRALPDIHIHAFSPEEVLYGARLNRLSVREFLIQLQEAGLDSLPGTSAEILEDRVRRRISPARISTTQWISAVTTAHRLGIRSSATIMYGHLESEWDRAGHLLLLRSLQRETGGFTELVPLSFVCGDSLRSRSILRRASGPTGLDVLKMHAVARLVLGRDIPHLQVSWVKEGLKLAQVCLAAGADDLGGTLMNESISSSAGAPHGEFMRPRDFRQLIRDAGRRPAERSTGYRILRLYSRREEPGETHPLDDQPPDRFALPKGAQGVR